MVKQGSAKPKTLIATCASIFAIEIAAINQQLRALFDTRIHIGLDA